MQHYDADLSATFHSFTPVQRDYFRWMLTYGFTEKVAIDLLHDGIVEERASGSRTVDGFSVRFTDSAWNDFELFRGKEIRERIGTILSDVTATKRNRRHEQLPGSAGWLLSEEMFRIVFKKEETNAPVICAIAVDGINPLQRVWRYFDQTKAEDLLRTGCLYFCRLDKLTGEGRLPLLSKRERTQAF